jgi:hypothetical protein
MGERKQGDKGMKEIKNNNKHVQPTKAIIPWLISTTFSQ